MKRIFKYLLIITALVAGGLVYTACSDMEKEYEGSLVEYPDITIDDFTPKSGRPGQAVTITGTNFGEFSDAAKIYFNGVMAAEFVSYTDNQMVVRVPNDAGTGIISVSVWTHTHDFAEDFTFVPGAKINGITPEEGAVGSQVTITGESFGTDASAVTILFGGGVEAQIVSITDNEIVVTVPEGGIRGAVTMEVGPQILTGPIFSYPFVGLNYQFNGADSEGWLSTHNSTSVVSGGAMNVTFDPNQFSGTSKRRADFQLAGGVELHAGLFPIIAIKLNKPANGNFILDTNLGRYKNGSNNWDGILQGDIYYYDIRNTFGSGATLSQTEPTTLTTFQWKIADITSPETGYSVDWVQSFESLDALNEYVALPEGKYVFEFDDPNTFDWTASHNSTVVIEGGKLKVSFDPAQFEGTNKRRADLYNVILGKFPYPDGAAKESWICTPEYPIMAFKITFKESGLAKPEAGNMKLDPYTGSNNSYKTDFMSQNVIYYDVSDKYTARTELNVWQLKIADITSAETGYEVDWIRTFKTTAELQAFLGL
ncbi:DUF4979 domain-containing protein [Gaoshiqia sediminis]|uniref:DUF4979 domain-containing protein n=1 Tax=Gaoshiqia sediminis TaxID=2986998 RepID=A0AA41Y7L8_9BACT|nr:DUF4979 domain-containing protein [Gaoshiqia sediminis]MCW0482383.1 DUF4979 domain-containing protein [Gaoshiqia sediminis]